MIFSRVILVACALACVPLFIQPAEATEPKNAMLKQGLIARMSRMSNRMARYQFQERVTKMLPLRAGSGIYQLGNALGALPSLSDLEQVMLLSAIDVDAEIGEIMTRSNDPGTFSENAPVPFETIPEAKYGAEDERLLLPAQIDVARRVLDLVGPWVVGRDGTSSSYAYAPRCVLRDQDVCKRASFVQIRRGSFYEADEYSPIGSEFDASRLSELQEDVIKRMPHVYDDGFVWFPLTGWLNAFHGRFIEKVATAVVDGVTLPFRGPLHWIDKAILRRKRKKSLRILAVPNNAI
ncbi:MAG TPA: hypothetical protein VM598_11975, partial [Bdellovibrionota bacterium]|nr:hypothetical protein [Bdellovibrionota bacterium]